MEDGAFRALCMLTRLTALETGSIVLANPTAGGHSPTLRRLEISHLLTPQELLQTVLPLSPLPALLNVSTNPSRQNHFAVRIACSDAQGADVQAAALKHFSCHLAACPCIHADLTVSLEGGGEPGPAYTISWQGVANGLAPLVHKMACIQLSQVTSISMDVMVLQDAFPHLHHLRVRLSRSLTDTILIALATLWPGLERLTVCDCSNVTKQDGSASRLAVPSLCWWTHS